MTHMTTPAGYQMKRLTILCGLLCIFLLAAHLPSVACSATIYPSVKEISSPTAHDGEIYMDAANGAPPYKYKLGINGTWSTVDTFRSLGAGVDTVYAKDQTACVQFAVITFGVVYPTVWSSNPAYNVCLNSGNQLDIYARTATHNPNYTYTWYGQYSGYLSGGGQADSLYSIAQPTGDSVYCSVYDPATGVYYNTPSVWIRASYPIIINTPVTNSPVAAGSAINIQVPFISNLPATVTIQGPANPLSFYVPDTLNFFSDTAIGYLSRATTADSGLYTVYMDNGACSASLTFSLSVTRPVAGCHIVAADTIVAPGCGSSNGTITVYASGGTQPYSYSRGSFGAVQTSSLFSNLPAGADTILVSDGAGCTKALIATLPLTSSVVPSVTISGANNICAGTIDSFHAVAVNGGGAPAYQWYRNGTPVGTNSPALGISTLATRDSVWVVLTSNASCATPATATSLHIKVTVNPIPAAPVMTVSGSGCVGDSLTLSGTGGSSQITWSESGHPFTNTYPTYRRTIAAGGNGSGAAANQFFGPDGIFIDQSGNLYVADYDNHRIQKFPAGSDSTTNGVTVAGGNGFGSAANQLYNPRGVYVDSTGNIYVADFNNNRIQKFPAGSSSATNGVTVAGGLAFGPAGNTFNGPWRVYVDRGGNIYVCDQTNNRIQKFPSGSVSGTYATTVAGGNGQGSAANQLNQPMGINIDSAGYLYVVDEYNHRIQKFAPGSTSASNGITVAGNNTFGGSGANELNYPQDIVLDGSGVFYVSDQTNFRVQKFPSGSTAATNGLTIAGGHGAGFGPNQLNYPDGMAKDAAGNIYVTDFGGDHVYRLLLTSPYPVYTTQASGSYTAIYTSSAGCASPASNAITISSSTLTVAVTASSVRLCGGAVDTFTAVVSTSNNPASYQWYKNGATVGSNTATYIATNVANNDNVWVVVHRNDLCAAITTLPSSHTILTVYPAPAVPLLTASGHACLGTDSLTLSGAGATWEIDWYRSASRIDSVGIITGRDTIAYRHIIQPTGITMDSAGYLYVAELSGDDVLRFPPGSTASSTGTIVAGGNGPGSGANQLYGPEDIALDRQGNLYVTDFDNARVQKFPRGSSTTTSAVTVAGGNGYGSSAIQLSAPHGIFIDSAGAVYVADAGNNRIQKFPAGSTASTSGVTVAGGNGAGSGANQLSYPQGVYVDGQGSIYVADDGNGRIQKFPAGSTSATNAVTVAGIGGNGNAANQLYGPYHVQLDKAGNIYVSDNSTAWSGSIKKFPAGSVSGTNGTFIAKGILGTGFYVDSANTVYASDFATPNASIRVFDQGPQRHTFVPTQPGYYTVECTSPFGCLSVISDSVLIDVCLPDSVWPGDADANRLVDNVDLLPIGLAYDSTGPARGIQGIVWQGDAAADWRDSFSIYAPHVNYKHADCNGDGVVDAHDTLAISQNFSLVHAKTNGGATPGGVLYRG